MKKQLEEIKRRVSELVVEDLNDMDVAETIGYISGCLDSLNDE